MSAPHESASPPLKQQLLLLVIFCVGANLLARGLSETFSVFLVPLTDRFETDRASVAAVYSSLMLVSGLAAPVAGYAFDHFGALRIYLTGFFLMGLSLILASQAASLWQIYVCIGLGMGLGAAALGNAPHSALLSRWFDGAGFSRVMSLVLAGPGVGTLALMPMTQLVIEHLGVPGAYLCQAGLLLLLAPLLYFIDWKRLEAGSETWNAKRQSRADQASPKSELAVYAKEWTTFTAMKTPAFWGMSSVFFFTGGGVMAVMVQGVAFMIEVGYSPLTAASIYGMVGLLAPVGILTSGWIDGRFGRQISAIMSYGLTYCGLAALWTMSLHQSMAQLVIFVAGVGLSFGTRGPLVAATAVRIFQGRHLGGIYGMIMLGGGFGNALGTYAGAKIHDLTGGYSAVFIYASISILLGAMPFWTYRALREPG